MNIGPSSNVILNESVLCTSMGEAQGLFTSPTVHTQLGPILPKGQDSREQMQDPTCRMHAGVGKAGWHNQNPILYTHSA